MRMLTMWALVVAVVAPRAVHSQRDARAPAASAVPVTAENFERAESDRYFGRVVKNGGFGKFHHNREPTPIDKQSVIRMNRDTLYSGAVFDLDAGPVTITMPDAAKRFMSMQVIDEDQFTPAVVYGAGKYTYTREQVGTRYVLTVVRTLIDPASPKDLEQVHKLQDAIQVDQKSPGGFEVPSWDPASQTKVRDALLVLGSTLPDSRRMFGTRDRVDPVRHLIGTAMGWGGNPEQDALYLNVTPGQNDGKTVYQLTVKDVPVDAFWSISVYNAEGFFQENKESAYTFNNLTAKKSEDGSITIQFGGCDSNTPNCLPTVPGWNYIVRLYRPRAAVLEGTWTFPHARPLERTLSKPAGERLGPVLRTESFDRDPGWDAQNNRIVPEKYPTIVQDFGFSRSNFAGKAAGEMGGQVWRASEPAFYAAPIGPRTLDDRMTASGMFAITRTTPGGGVFFGFFRAAQPRAGGRPIASLGLHLDSEHTGARLAVRLITGQNQSCGTFITPFIPGKFRPTPIRNDGTRYAWTLDYDPQANDGRGRFTFTLRSDAHMPGELEKADLPESFREEAHRRFPSTTTFAVDLPEGYRRQATTFDHFGLMNMMKAGGRMAIDFDDLSYLGRTEDFADDPHWDASGNRLTYQATDVGGAHNFGFSPTNHAGGRPGELGGTFWRAGPYSYYADRVGPLSLDDRLEARGRVVLAAGAPDADMYLGWFNSAEKERPPLEAGHFLGVHVGGPTRVGHYFHPTFATANGTRGQAEGGPVLRPGRTYEWSLVYDPAAEGGRGAIGVTLGDESVTLALKNGIKAQGARFDRFGVFTSTIGGQVVRIFLDDLNYTAGPP